MEEPRLWVPWRICVETRGWLCGMGLVLLRFPAQKRPNGQWSSRWRGQAYEGNGVFDDMIFGCGTRSNYDRLWHVVILEWKNSQSWQK